jgi:hypothetical protein
MEKTEHHKISLLQRNILARGIMTVRVCRSFVKSTIVPIGIAACCANTNNFVSSHSVLHQPLRESYST